MNRAHRYYVITIRMQLVTFDLRLPVEYEFMDTMVFYNYLVLFWDLEY